MNLYRILFTNCGSSEKQTISEFRYNDLSESQKIELNNNGHIVRNVYRSEPGPYEWCIIVDIDNSKVRINLKPNGYLEDILKFQRSQKLDTLI